MIKSFFTFEGTCTRLCQGAVGPYIDFLAAALIQQGYSKDRGRRILRGATAFGRWLTAQGIALEDADKHSTSYLHQLDIQPNGRRPGAATCVKQLLQILGEQHVLRDSGTPSTAENGGTGLNASMNTSSMLPAWCLVHGRSTFDLPNGSSKLDSVMNPRCGQYLRLERSPSL